MINIQLSNVADGKINVPVHVTANITSDIAIKNIEWMTNKQVNFSVSQDQKTLNFTPSENGEYVFTATVWDTTGNRASATTEIDVGIPTPVPSPTPEPTPQPQPTAGVLYDSTVNSSLHDGKESTFTQIGNIGAGGLGLECRASGNPRIRKNADKTFSLLCDGGHGRFYGYCKNYNATLELEAAFWNQAAGQDCSLKMRSRHNEGGDGPNRFGGYGFDIDRSGWGGKREIYHNVHDEATSGSLPVKPETQKYWKIEFTVKDEGPIVWQIAKFNGTVVMNKQDKNPEAYMKDKASFDKQSYFWVRQNLDSGTGELRIKRLRILSA